MIAAMEDRERRRSFVLASEGWHAGVVGIVLLVWSSVISDPWCYSPSLATYGAGLGTRNPVGPSLRGAPPLRYRRALWRSSHGGRHTIRTERLKEFADRFRGRHRGDDTGGGIRSRASRRRATDPEDLGPETMEDLSSRALRVKRTASLFLAEGWRSSRAESSANATSSSACDAVEPARP
jgi:hypothetical protein